MKSSSELSQDIANAEQEEMKAIKSLATVSAAIQQYKRDILEIRLKMKDLEIAEDKGKLNIKELKLAVSTLTKSFWNTKNQGL